MARLLTQLHFKIKCIYSVFYNKCSKTTWMERTDCRELYNAFKCGCWNSKSAQITLDYIYICCMFYNYYTNQHSRFRIQGRKTDLLSERNSIVLSPLSHTGTQMYNIGIHCACVCGRGRIALLFLWHNMISSYIRLADENEPRCRTCHVYCLW